MKLNISLKENPIHLYCFPILFVVNHFFAIVATTYFFGWLLNFIYAVGFCLFLPLVGNKIFLFSQHKIKSAILSTVISFPFFFFQDIFLSIEQFASLGLRARWVVPFLVVMLTALCYWIIKSNRSLGTVNHYLNVVSVLLLIYTTVALGLSVDRLKPQVLSYEPPSYPLECGNCADVYLIVLDSYTSNESLMHYFGYDNSDFTNKLTDLSFVVASEVKSAYSLTQFSMASTLNLNKIENLDQYNSGLAEVINRSSVIKSFQQAGYRINNYSLFEVGDQGPYYSIVPDISIGWLNGIIQSSSLNMFYDFFLKTTLYDIHSDILEEIHEISIQNNNKPDFIYAHILAPHPPFVINDIGQEINFFNQRRNKNNKAAYVSQVQGLNGMLYPVIQSIRRSSPDAIVIIAGDHGYRYLRETEDAKDEPYTVFLAYHGPQQDRISSMEKSNDIFRLVFRGFQIDPKQ